MDAVFWFNVLSRWIHVTSAAVAVGVLVGVWWVFAPALQAATEREAGTIREVMERRLRTLLHVAIGLLLLTGLYNLVVVIPRADGLGGLKPIYHSLLGTKILIGLVVIGLAEMLFSRSPRLERLRTARTRWLAITIALVLLVLLFSATLRRFWDLQPRLEAAPTRATAPNSG